MMDDMGFMRTQCTPMCHKRMCKGVGVKGKSIWGNFCLEENSKGGKGIS